MKKITYWRCVGLAVLTILISACTNKNAYLDTIPDDVLLAAKINVNQILSKSAVLEDSQVRGQFKDLFREFSSSTTRELMIKLLNNPEECGIDFDQSIVCAVTNFENEEWFIAMAVQDEAKLQYFLDVLSDDRDLDLDINFFQKGEYTIVEIYGEEVMCFNKKKCVLAYSYNYCDASQYMNIEKHKQAISNANFKTFCKESKDVVLYGDFEKIMKVASRKDAELDFEAMKEWCAKAYLLLSLNFEEGKVNMVANFCGNDKFKELANLWQINPTKSNIGLIPQKSLAVVNFGIHNLTKFIEELDLHGDILDELDDILDDFDLRIRDLDVINGDVTLAILPVETLGEEELPQFMAIAECSNSRWFDMEVSQNKDWEEVDDHVYAIHANRHVDWHRYVYYDEWVYREDGYDYYVGYLDGKLFIMPENIYSKCVKRNCLSDLAANFKNNELYSRLQKNGVVCDVKFLVDELSKTDELEDDDYWLMARRYLKKFKSATMTYEEQVATISIELTDNTENSLKIITDALIGFACQDM